MAVKNISILTGTNYNTVEELLYEIDTIDMLLIYEKIASGDYKGYMYVGDVEIESICFDQLNMRVDRYDIRKEDGKYIAEIWCY